MARSAPLIGIGRSGGLPAVPLRAGAPDTVAMARRLADTGVFINNADGFALYDHVPTEELRTGIALMAEMGAHAIVTLQFDSHAARGFDRFCQLRDWVAKARLALLLEFPRCPASQV